MLMNLLTLQFAISISSLLSVVGVRFSLNPAFTLIPLGLPTESKCGLNDRQNHAEESSGDESSRRTGDT
jgi:hypothetical protein